MVESTGEHGAVPSRTDSAEKCKRGLTNEERRLLVAAGHSAGNEHFQRKDLDAAIACYTQAISLDGKNHVYYANRSACHAAKGAWAQAAADAQKSLDLGPQYVKGYYRLALARVELSQPDSAAQAARAGLDHDPHNRDLQRLLRRAEAEASERGRPVGSAASKLKGDGGTGGAKRGRGRSRQRLGNLELYADKEAVPPPAESTESTLDRGQGPEQQAGATALHRVLERLKSSVSKPGGGGGLGPDVHILDGVFHKLMDGSSFRQTLFPGLSAQQRKHFPATFQELLNDPKYAKALELAVPLAMEQATKVLEAVKAKAKKAGEPMPPATEEALKPQVLQEAFGRAVVQAVQSFHAQARAQVAGSTHESRLASVDDERARWDQVEDYRMEGLLDTEVACAVQENFLGEEWPALIREDALRLCAQGRVSPAPTGERDPKGLHGEMAWVEPQELEEGGYPALLEAVKNLHALPFELNQKAGPQWRLNKAFPGSTQLARLWRGCRLPERLDGITTTGQDSGHEITCIYFLGSSASAHDAPWEAGQGGELRLRAAGAARHSGCGAPHSHGGHSLPKGATGAEAEGMSTATQSESEGLSESHLSPGAEQPAAADEPDGQGGPAGDGETVAGYKPAGAGVVDGVLRTVEPKADTLVLFRSRLVLNKTLEVCGPDQLMLFFWITGHVLPAPA